jgi:hypothetical protein
VPCRKYSVILLTDGAESCQGNPIASATALRNVVPATDVKTYVIGFSTLPTETAQLNAVATAGGTTAFFASDSSGISNAFASIIAASTNYEKCNGLDDDCDGLIDEDFPDKGATCDNGLKGVCKGTGVRICNATQDGTTCQITVPGLAPKAEVCNGLDDNCNGLVDEGGVCQLCVPTVEVCNNIDDNCDGIIDNNPVDANQPCGVATGECAPGVTACGPGGVLTCTGAIGPQGETCNGLDDDCNGVVDGMTAACYAGPVGTSGVGVCHPGSQPCTAVVGSGVPAYGPCVGQIVPSTELCDGLDNDCNGKVDDKVPDGFGHMTGDACCPSAGKCAVGVCTFGAYACAGSQVVCDGAILPSPELCDGLDNDCNGTVDDVPGKGIACVLPGGCPGMLDCQVGVGLVCVSAATGVEICDGIDNDCDGSIDEEPDVSVNDPKLGVVCDVPAAPNDKAPCAPGKTVCKSGKPVCGGAVTPAPEVCDGVDNDCDGNVDQPNPCAGELVCTNGMCLGKCQGGEFPCPGGEACMNGVCVPAMTDGGMPAGSSGASGSSGAGGSASGTTTTSGSGGAGGVPSTSATSTTTGGVTASGAGGAGGDPNVFGLATGGGGCACDVAGDRGIPGRLALITAVGLALGARRRRRSPRVAGGAQ